MKAPQRPSRKPVVFDLKIEEALRSAVRLGVDLSLDDVSTLQRLVWDLPSEANAVHEVLRDLAWDLEFTQDGPSFEREKAMTEIAATLETIEDIIRLEQEIGPVYDAMQASPHRGIPARDVFASIRAHHADQVKKT
jgi:hypothetical protein